MALVLRCRTRRIYRRGLAFITFQIVGRTKVMKGAVRRTMYGLRVCPATACYCGPRVTKYFPPSKRTHKAMYWTTSVNGAGDFCRMPLRRAVFRPTMHSGQLMSDATRLRGESDQSVYHQRPHSSRQNPRRSTDIYLQNSTPAGHESNWLPAPTGKFILWLRVYLPGAGRLEQVVPRCRRNQSKMI